MSLRVGLALGRSGPSVAIAGITFFPVTVPENSASSFAVGTATTTEASPTWSLTVDAGGFFAIDASGNVTLTATGAAGIDYEATTSYSITISDGTNTRDRTIQVGDINEPPVFSGAPTALNYTEGVAASATDFFAFLVDPEFDAGNAVAPTYSISPAVPAGFSFSSAGVLTPDTTSVVAGASYTITATDALGLTVTHSLTIEVFAPLSLSLSNSSVDEGLSGATIGTLSVTGATGLVVYTIPEPETDGQIAGDELQTVREFDYSIEPTVPIDVIATDANGTTGTATFTITVNEVVANTAPTKTSSPLEFTVVATSAPVLSSAADAANGGTASTGTVSTDIDNGTLYTVVSTSSTAPTATQVEAGQDHTGASAAADTSQTVSATGVQNVSLSGLTSETAYFTHYMHKASDSTQSAVASATGFTTADITAPALTGPTDANSGDVTSTGSVTTDEADGTLYWVVTTSATAPTAAQVKLGQDDSGAAATDDGSQAVTATGVQNITGAGLTASTAYTTHFMHEDSDGNQSAVSSASGFTTTAGAGGGELMPDPGFDNASAWNQETETSVTGSVLDYNTTANFRDCYTENGFRPSASPSTTYDFSIDATVTTGARVRFGYTEYNSGGAAITSISYFLDVNPMTTGTHTGSFTTSAGAVDTVRITIQSVLNPFVGEFDNISLTEQ